MKKILETLVLFAWLALPAMAGDGYTDPKTGHTVIMKGYGGSSGEIYSSPSIPIDFNRAVWIKNGDPEWVTLETSHSEIQALVQNTAFSLGLWENIPTSRLRFHLGFYRNVFNVVAHDSFNLMTLAGGDYEWGGQAKMFLMKDGKGMFRIDEFDCRIRRNVSQTEVRSYIVHEIGHGIGFNHNWLHRDVVKGLTGAMSPHSIMSYSYGDSTIINAGALNGVDVAIASRLYPNFFNPLWKTTGSVKGIVFDKSGKIELYGANVLLVEQKSGKAILSRISGFSEARSKGNLTGGVLLDGIPAGKYDLLIAPMSDPDVTLGKTTPSIDRVKFKVGMVTYTAESDNFASGFKRAWVRNIHVSAGRVVDAGSIRAGTDRSIQAPGMVDVEVTYKGKPCIGYWVDFWGAHPWGMAHQSPFMKSPRYQARLPEGKYAVRIWGKIGPSNWKVVQGWKWRTCTGVRATFGWPSKAKTIQVPFQFWGLTFHYPAQVTPYEYRVRIKTKKGSLVWDGSIRGNSLEYLILPGEYELRVWVRWTEDGKETFIHYSNMKWTKTGSFFWM